MIKTTIGIDGMMCGMCESHVSVDAPGGPLVHADTGYDSSQRNR